MAITKRGEVEQINGHDGQAFNIYNGDWEVLQKITKKWNLNDEANALRFAIAILFKANTNNLFIDDEAITPAKPLLKDKDDEDDKQ